LNAQSSHLFLAPAVYLQQNLKKNGQRGGRMGGKERRDKRNKIKRNVGVGLKIGNCPLLSG
jgi:hypothetical protein